MTKFFKSAGWLAPYLLLVAPCPQDKRQFPSRSPTRKLNLDKRCTPS